MSKIKEGNVALQNEEYQKAISYYLMALKKTPMLAKTISDNLYFVRRKLLLESKL